MRRVFRFGPFDLVPEDGELRRRGVRLPLPPKPFAALCMLLERAGEPVLRDELRHRLWGDVHVGFEHAIDNAVSRVRATLGDSARAPRWVETLPRRGYRFVGRVEIVVDAPTAARFSRRAAFRSAALAIGLSAAVTSPGSWSPRAVQQGEAHAPARNRPRELLAERDRLLGSLAISPDSAPERASLALLLIEMIDWRLLPRTELDHAARDAAAAALRLDPTCAEAQAAAGLVAAFANSNWPEAAARIERALVLAPASVRVLSAAARVRAAEGRLAVAALLAERAAELAPESARAQVLAGRLAYFARRNDAAASRLTRALRLDPEDPAAHKFLSDVLWQQGRTMESGQHLQAWLAGLGVAPLERRRVAAALDSGGLPALWRENARRAEGAPESAASRDGVPFKVAGFYAPLGETGPALAWLARALEQRDPQLLYLDADPSFDPIRREPAYAAFRARVAAAFRLPERRA